MPQYLALTYTADVNWWAPEQASELAESLDGPASQPERHHRERRRAAFFELARPTAPDQDEP